MRSKPDPVSQTQVYLDTNSSFQPPTIHLALNHVFAKAPLLRLSFWTPVSCALLLHTACHSTANLMSRLVKQIRPFELVIMRKELKEAIVFILVSVKLLCTDGPNFFFTWCSQFFLPPEKCFRKECCASESLQYVCGVSTRAGQVCAGAEGILQGAHDELRLVLTELKPPQLCYFELG